MFDGETATLSPSVGSWDFPCRSHYFIRHDTVVWGADMSQKEIESGRDHDRKARDKHFKKPKVAPAKPRKRKES